MTTTETPQKPRELQTPDPNEEKNLTGEKTFRLQSVGQNYYCSSFNFILFFSPCRSVQSEPSDPSYGFRCCADSGCWISTKTQLPENKM